MGGVLGRVLKKFLKNVKGFLNKEILDMQFF